MAGGLSSQEAGPLAPREHDVVGNCCSDVWLLLHAHGFSVEYWRPGKPGPENNIQYHDLQPFVQKVPPISQHVNTSLHSSFPRYNIPYSPVVYCDHVKQVKHRNGEYLRSWEVPACVFHAQED